MIAEIIISLLTICQYIPMAQGSKGKASAADIIEHRAEAPEAKAQKSETEEGFSGTSPGGMGSFVEHKDGRLMFISGWNIFYSSDSGRTWSEPTKLSVPQQEGGLEGAIRLKSGKIGLYSSVSSRNERNFDIHRLYWWTSEDEGETWSERVHINPTGQLGLPYYDTMIQTQLGRLILPVRSFNQGHEGMYEQTGAWGIVGGERTKVEGHAHWPEMDVGFVYYSDDEGKTWSRSDREIVGWKDKGYGGMWPVDEPNVIELKDGRIMMFARTSLGRIYKVISADGGNRWSLPEVTDLASSYSPCRLRRIPTTGDLICVWNHVSGAEIRAGFRRGRLSATISQDDGETWENFKTIDTAGLPVAGRVEPDPQPGMARGNDDVGELPPDYGGVSYPNIGFHKNDVLIIYHWSRLHPQQGGIKLRIFPVEWFYSK